MVKSQDQSKQLKGKEGIDLLLKKDISKKIKSLLKQSHLKDF